MIGVACGGPAAAAMMQQIEEWHRQHLEALADRDDWHGQIVKRVHPVEEQ